MTPAPAEPFPTSRSLEDLLMALTGKRPLTKPSKLTAIAGNGRLPWFAGLYTVDGQEQPSAAILVDYAAALGSTAAMMETPQTSSSRSTRPAARMRTCARRSTRSSMSAPRC